MKKIPSSLALITLLIPSIGFSASFDCSKATSVTEKLICADEKLSALDEQLASSYKKALEAATDKDAVKKTQIEWLKGQRSCNDSTCLAEKYQAQITALNNPSSLSASKPSAITTAEPKQKIVVAPGYDKPLCNDYAALMQRVPRNPQNTCGLEYSFDDRAKAQGFSDIAWEEVDPKKYEDMLLKYWMYINRDWTSDEGKKKKKEEFYSYFLKTKAWLWHATIDLNNDGKPDDVFKLVSRDCVLENASFFIASDKGFTSQAPYWIAVSGATVFQYKGKIYSVSGNIIQEPSGGDVFVNAGMFATCAFKPEF